jgi:antirestriction protein ArdC
MSSVYEIITEQVIKQLESGVAPWSRPWQTSAPKNLITQREYSGFNVIMLASQGYASPYWMTFNQCNKLGGRIRQGEHSSLVTFWQLGKYSRKNRETGEDETRRSMLLRYYRVFNLTQTEGIAEKLGLSTTPRHPSIETCESIVSEMPNPPKRESSDRAWYRPSSDTVGMPAKDSF